MEKKMNGKYFCIECQKWRNGDYKKYTITYLKPFAEERKREVEYQQCADTTICDREDNFHKRAEFTRCFKLLFSNLELDPVQMDDCWKHYTHLPTNRRFRWKSGCWGNGMWEES